MKKSPLILQTIKKDISKNKWIYIMAIPVIVFYICFSYIPMAGIQIAFKDFNFGAGIWGSPWVGFKHFISFFSGAVCLACHPQYSVGQPLHHRRVLSCADPVCTFAQRGKKQVV